MSSTSTQISPTTSSRRNFLSILRTSRFKFIRSFRRHRRFDSPLHLCRRRESVQNNIRSSAWHIKGVRYTREKITGDHDVPATNGASFHIVVTRRSGFYIWKIFVPLLMLIMIPMVVFWIDVSQFDWILKIPMTMLLSMVASDSQLRATSHASGISPFWMLSFSPVSPSAFSGSSKLLRCL